ncbi:MAG: sugar transferase [Mastigocoleus sp.]
MFNSTSNNNCYLNEKLIFPNQSELSKLQKETIHPSVKSVTKRLIDIFGAIIGLMITAIVIIPVAIASYFNNPGPIFYSQTRCGFKGCTFKMWKFRSMIVDADKFKDQVRNGDCDLIVIKSEQNPDPRITPVGKFLRSTSLDELPQFWNVLKGDMSLVGTRPPTLDEVMHYESHHWGRLNVKPGMTGEWQANGRSIIKDFEMVVKMDMDYQRKWSVSYDIYLIFKTIGAVIKKKGAC